MPVYIYVGNPWPLDIGMDFLLCETNQVWIRGHKWDIMRQVECEEALVVDVTLCK